MLWYQWLCLFVIPIWSYLSGSFSTAVVISKTVYGQDVRTQGSGNAGMTNMLRVFGKRAAIFTLLGDVGKAAIAIIPSKLALMAIGFEAGSLGYVLGSCMAAFFVIVGHIKPVWFGFRGGKGVLTTVGVWFFVDWRVALLSFITFLILVIITRYVSLGSICGMATAPLWTVIFGALVDQNPYYYVFLVTVTLVAALSIYMHKANIVRLCQGTESKLGSKKKEEATQEERQNH